MFTKITSKLFVQNLHYVSFLILCVVWQCDGMHHFGSGTEVNKQVVNPSAPLVTNRATAGDDVMSYNIQEYVQKINELEREPDEQERKLINLLNMFCTTYSVDLPKIIGLLGELFTNQPKLFLAGNPVNEYEQEFLINIRKCFLLDDGHYQKMQLYENLKKIAIKNAEYFKNKPFETEALPEDEAMTVLAAAFLKIMTNNKYKTRPFAIYCDKKNDIWTVSEKEPVTLTDKVPISAKPQKKQFESWHVGKIMLLTLFIYISPLQEYCDPRWLDAISFVAGLTGFGGFCFLCIAGEDPVEICSRLW
jgi:hypothetical protein